MQVRAGRYALSSLTTGCARSRYAASYTIDSSPHASVTTICPALGVPPKRENALSMVDLALFCLQCHRRPNHLCRRSGSLGENPVGRPSRTRGESQPSAKTVSSPLAALAHVPVSPMSILGSTHTSHWFSSGEGVMRFSGSTSGMPIL